MDHDKVIEFLQDIPGETISPSQAAEVLGGKPYSYNVSAKAGNLSLPHIWRGRNLRIFKEPLLRVLKGEVA